MTYCQSFSAKTCGDYGAGCGPERPKFVRVLPNDYRRVVDAQRKMRDKGLSPDEAEMAAFEQNTRDEARVGGN